MDNTVGLLLISLISTVFAQYSLTPVLNFESIADTTLMLNIGDTATLNCVIKSSRSFIAPTDKAQLYKKQEDTWIPVAALSPEALESGFDSSKFTLETIWVDSAADVITLKVAINTIDVTDTGSYKCITDAKGTEFESGEIKIVVLAGSGGPFSFTTQAEKNPDGSRYLFNDHHEVSCSGEATTINPALQLKVTLAGINENNDTVDETDAGDITNLFQISSKISWTGEDGRKTPTQQITLTAADYMPDLTGTARLTCVLSEGENQLSVQNLDILREAPKATASLKCGKSFEKEAYVGQLDAILNCTVSDFTGDSSGLTVKWELIHENCTAPVTIYTGQTKYSQTASADADRLKHMIKINRITKVLAGCGARSLCTATLVESGKENDVIAKADCSFMIDTTSEIGGSGSVITASWILLVSSVCQSLL